MYTQLDTAFNKETNTCVYATLTGDALFMIDIGDADQKAIPRYL